jgi:Ubiquitin-activating enzyme E1 FCCH domain
MNGFQQVLIGGYPGGGLTQDRKPALLSNEAFSTLENAYVYRERTKKRDGEVPMGRLSRLFAAVSLGVSGASPWTFNIYTRLSITPEPNAQINPGSVSIFIVGVSTPFVDQGNGTLTNATPGNSGIINYLTGSVTLITTASTGSAATITFSYFPSLPVMGILKREVATIGIDFTVFFDTKYAYQFVSGFQELVPGFTWTGTNTDFFWAANFQGATPDLRYFFVTNNNIDTVGGVYDPIRYFNNSTWINLQPLLTSTITLWQAQILIPYYGRLLALNTWEGPTGSTFTGATNFFARCRFSQLGDPTDQTNGWRSDIFGRGGFIDAPTNEAIVSAAFFRNTLIVFFEYSTWQLRYIGEYGLPFIFERISSDFGAISTYSPIVFDQGVMVVNDRGIIQAAANGVTRLDDQIPDQVFGFEIQNSAPNFVHGVRDFQKELVYWNYLDTENSSTTQTFPNRVLLFNYRNNSWAKFRDNITCFGPAQFQFAVTWDSLTTLWESTVTWDNVDDQQFVEYVTSGTPNGFINIFNNPDAETPQPVTALYAPSMAITAVNFGVSPNQVTIPNHNLANSEIIYIQGLIWSGTDPGLNNIIYSVTIVDANTVTLNIWDFVSQSYDAVNITSSATYLGGGVVTLFPKMNIVGKDFNPFQGAGKQFKLSYIDFQMDSNLISPAIAATTIQLFVNSYLGEQANLIATNQELINSSQNCGFITNATQANPCQITSPNHSLITGTLIYIANVQGMTQLNAAIYSLTVVDSNNFTLDNTDSTGFSLYTTGGIWNTSPVNGQTYIQGSQYAWYRFYSTQFGQYLRVGLTYDNNLMNQLATHQTPMELNAMNLWFREGGRIIN